ncbi:unnamed protein product [Cladocopium goreaui]|uniref:Peptidase S54 rhomboid domain-containing protein n=1 Tax=Cladocopium goreaui TaxID=2562237 RepID=A0A9P1G5A7_9DINO|nr:unnamed protein product [Cladocopium goreaui]
MQRERDYLLCISPLLAGLLAMPTVEEATSGRFHWPRLVSAKDMLRTYRSLVLTQPSLERGEWWRLISYLFIHQDLEHLLNNICGILCSGFTVFNNCGVEMVYGIFFWSGAVAGLNSWGRTFQTESQLEASIPAVPKSLGSAVPESAQIWDRFRHAAAKWTAPIVSSRTDSYGASGGVSGLMGFTLGLSLRRFWTLLGLAGTRAARDASEPRARRQRGHAGLELLVTGLNLFQTGKFLLQEWESIRGDRGLTGVDHAGHLTGFTFGLVSALVTMA